MEKRVEELSRDRDRLKKELNELTLEYEEASQKVKELAEEKQTLKESLESELVKLQQGLDRCESNNAKLCLMASELVDKYKEKGLVKTFLQREPFTQIKKIELEELINEYQEKINQYKIQKPLKSRVRLQVEGVDIQPDNEPMIKYSRSDYAQEQDFDS